MSNKLKNFINGNRKAFDDEMPSDKVWENIEASFAEKKKKRFILKALYKWSMAAVAMLVIALSIFFSGKKAAEQEVISGAETDINKLAPDYAPQMNQFVKMIDTRQEKLKTLAQEQPELHNQFNTDINQLYSSYNNVKNQLSATPNREMLLEAMIQNLQLQLNVLNQQLNIINQIEEQKKYSYEKNDQNI